MSAWDLVLFKMVEFELQKTIIYVSFLSNPSANMCVSRFLERRHDMDACLTFYIHEIGVTVCVLFVCICGV